MRRWSIILLLLLGSQALAKDAAELASLEILSKLEQGELVEAKSLARDLTRAFPEFNLGHLLYADIQAIETGHNPNQIHLVSNSEFTLRNLRDEAITRRQSQLYPPPQGALPSSIAKLAPDVPYALVTDLTRSRLYIFANQLGEPQLVEDHYIGMGKAGFLKQKEGDNRTPLGVYRINSYIPDERLPDLYGAGAYPLNYPNPWDKLKQRTGYGIWIHGVPHENYNRPPLSSEGCITLNNNAFDGLAKYIKTGTTPVINVDDIEWLTTSDWAARQKSLMEALTQWESDWESRDAEAYLQHYAKDFSNGKRNYAAWATYKRQVNAAKRYIKVELSNINMFEYAGEQDVIQVDFDQRYESDNLNSTSHKMQLWRQTESGWEIVYEGLAG